MSSSFAPDISESFRRAQCNSNTVWFVSIEHPTCSLTDYFGKARSSFSHSVNFCKLSHDCCIPLRTWAAPGIHKMRYIFSRPEINPNIIVAVSLHVSCYPQFKGMGISRMSLNGIPTRPFLKWTGPPTQRSRIRFSRNIFVYPASTDFYFVV